MLTHTIKLVRCAKAGGSSARKLWARFRIVKFDRELRKAFGNAAISFVEKSSAVNEFPRFVQFAEERSTRRLFARSSRTKRV